MSKPEPPVARKPVLLGPATRLNQALDLHPDVVDYVVSLHPHDFSRLHNPLMRKLMSPRITLGRVAEMAGVPLAEFLSRLTIITGVPHHADGGRPLPNSATDAPEWVELARDTDIPVVDLRPLDERLDADPMPPVMLAAKALPPGGVMVIHHKWEPRPFYDVWSQSGFEWFAEEVEPEQWNIWLRRVP